MMLDVVRKWIDGTGRDKQEILNRLTADSVKQHKNKRIGDNSPDEGHVHNSLLPEGGLQQVLQQHNVHVVRDLDFGSLARLIIQPGAGILNAGQDLMSGKKVRSAKIREAHQALTHLAMGPGLRIRRSARLA
jgi:hypothetical protein